MTRRDWLLSIAALAIVTLLLFWQPIGAWLGLLERKEVEIDRGPTAEARALPLFAAERLLQHFHVKTGRLAHLDQLPPTSDTLIVPTEEVWLTPLQAHALQSWVEQGGNLLLLLPASGVDFEGSLTDQFLQTFGLSARWPSEVDVSTASGFRQGGRLCPPIGITDPELPDQNNALPVWLQPPLVPSSTKLTIHRGRRGNAGPEIKAQVEPDCWVGPPAGPERANDWYWMTHQRVGPGALTVFAESELFNNLELVTRGSAHLLVGMAHFPRTGVTVWFPRRISQPALVNLLARLGLPFGLSLLLLLAAWVWKTGSRFGPLLPLPSTDRRRLLEHIEAAGRWSWKMKLADVLLSAVREAALTRAARRDQRWRTVRGEAMRRALQQELMVSAKDLDDAFAVGPHPHAESFTKSVRLWETMRRDG